MPKENHEDMTALEETIEAGKVTPVIDRTYPLSEAPAAILYMQDGNARGKVVLPGFGEAADHHPTTGVGATEENARRRE